MSHVAVIDLHVTDLDALTKGCKMLGLTIEKRSHWRWFGSWVDDYHATEAAYNFGINPSEYGKCAEYVITIPGDNHCYEIGVVPRPDGNGWMLVYDFFSGGHGMGEKVGGQKCGKLKQAYAANVSVKKVNQKKGFNYKVHQKKNGHVQIVARRPISRKY